MTNQMTSLEIYELIRDKAEPSYSINHKVWLSKEFVEKCIDDWYTDKESCYCKSLKYTPKCSQCIDINKLKQKLEKR